MNRFCCPFLVALLLAAMPCRAVAQDAQETKPKVKVFIPSLSDSWIKTIPSASPEIVVAPDGKTFAINGHEHAVRIFNTKSGDEVSMFKLPGGSSAKTMAFSPDGSNLATIRSYSRRTEVQVWNPVDGKSIWRQVIHQQFPERSDSAPMIGLCRTLRPVFTNGHSNPKY